MDTSSLLNLGWFKKNNHSIFKTFIFGVIGTYLKNSIDLSYITNNYSKKK